MVDFNNTTPYICPYCGADGYREDMKYEGDYIEFRLECSECNESWLELYDLTKVCEKTQIEK